MPEIEVTVQLTIQEGADPETAAEAAFDVLASVGENPDALELFDADVVSVNGYEWRPLP